jgi:hypothetical protein
MFLMILGGWPGAQDVTRKVARITFNRHRKVLFHIRFFKKRTSDIMGMEAYVYNYS